MARELDYLFADLDDDDMASRLKARRARSARRKDNSLDAARRALEAARAAIGDAFDAAHMEILRLLESQDATLADDSKSTIASRRKALDDLDRIHVGASARAATSIERGGGAHTVNHCREVELRRLGLLQ